MPVHDWSRVNAGIFHSFHLSWTDEIMAALNAGLLPPDYYALAEQLAGEFGPDVLALRFTGPDVEAPDSEDCGRPDPAESPLHRSHGDGSLRPQTEDNRHSPQQWRPDRRAG